jgi:hypothetical protein
LNAACERALSAGTIGGPNRRSIEVILKRGLDLQPSRATSARHWPTLRAAPAIARSSYECHVCSKRWSRAAGDYSSLLGRLSRIYVLVLDDFLLNPMTDVERRDLLEVLEDRYDRTSTVITTQVPTKTWHEALTDPTIADAICDRLVHNAHVLKLGGPSIRRKKALQQEPQPSA